MRRLGLLLTALALPLLLCATAASGAPQHVRTQVVKNNCRYAGFLQRPIAHRSATMWVTKDTCGRNMRGFAYCFQLPPLTDFYARGPWVNKVGEHSTAPCGGSSFAVQYAGYRYYFHKQPGNKPAVGTYGLYGSPPIRTTHTTALVRHRRRTCSQSVYPTRPPHGIIVTYSARIRTDTCGRWIRAVERCRYPGLTSPWSFKWHADTTPVRALGAKTSVYCGTLGVNATNWGFEFYNHGTKRWVYKQEGHT